MRPSMSVDIPWLGTTSLIKQPFSGPQTKKHKKVTKTFLKTFFRDWKPSSELKTFLKTFFGFKNLPENLLGIQKPSYYLRTERELRQKFEEIRRSREKRYIDREEKYKPLLEPLHSVGSQLKEMSNTKSCFGWTWQKFFGRYSLWISSQTFRPTR